MPPAISRWAARYALGGNFFQDFDGTWEEALASVRGYGDAAIIDQVTAATRAVENGDAAFERDSVLFSEPEYTWPLVAALCHAAARDGHLRVIDFGGSLGSSYRQHRRYLDDMPDSLWAVVEQAEFVQIGQREFSTDILSFHSTIAEAAAAIRPNVLLLGSSLQYLPSPEEILREATATPANTLILDRTPLSAAPDDRLTIQTVPARIYRAAYPMWVLSRSRLLDRVSPSWSVVATYESPFRRPRTAAGLEFGWDGLILSRGGT